MNQEYIIDRFEGEFAICELPSGAHENYPIEQLPKGVKEGDLLIREGDRFVIDREKTEQRRRTISMLQRKLKGKER